MSENAAIVIEPADSLGLDAMRLLRAMTEEIDLIYHDLFANSAALVNAPPEPRAVYLLAHLDGVAVASGTIRPTEHPDVAEVGRMYVVPSARRMGIARHLLAELERWGTEFGYRTLRLETGNRQLGAIALYTSHGFRPIPLYGRYIGDPVSCCFAKELLSTAENR